MAVLGERSPRQKARIAGCFYLLTFVTGVLALVSVNGRTVANLLATTCYVVVTLLFYEIFAAVNKSVSLLAALASMLGCIISVLGSFGLIPSEINSLAFFGVYCLLIGYLILNSTFLPRILGVLVAMGGLGWLTFASPSLAKQLSPFNMLPGVIGEGALTVWLLIAGVNEMRWKQQASA